MVRSDNLVFQGLQAHKLWNGDNIRTLSTYLGLPPNTISGLQPKKSTEGVIQCITNLRGDVRLPFIAADKDMGLLTKALVVAHPGKNLIAWREWVTMNEFAETFTRAVGFPAKVVTLPPGESYIAPPEPSMLQAVAVLRRPA
ncbi:hypothetical protein AJ79_06864 [Helicocarpus griseus UAMH5409]|uniref:NmrA-like domain-containing protein n=1 Tax=Helicocarpus griseus UAMH5409 TaxID=1447875 RepID=A0A2B7X7S4_9EURO|nr:hypothetical protein AJ79_06864 [Helicocarpus griseus UAMH5409]